MHVTINGVPEEAAVALRRAAGQLGVEHLYVNDMQVVRVTHSRSDAIPVILAIDEETVVEVDPDSFYALDGMHHDWQPGSQEGSLSAG
jgi:predicted metallopeptidase